MLSISKRRHKHMIKIAKIKIILISIGKEW